MHEDQGLKRVQIERVTDRIIRGMPGMERPAVRHMVAVAMQRLGTPITDEALANEAYLIEYVPGTPADPLAAKPTKAIDRASRQERLRDQPWRKGHA